MAGSRSPFTRRIAHKSRPKRARAHAHSRGQWFLREVTCPPGNSRDDGRSEPLPRTRAGLRQLQRRDEETKSRRRERAAALHFLQAHKYKQWRRVAAAACPGFRFHSLTHACTHTDQSGTGILLAAEPLPPADLDGRRGRGKARVNDSWEGGVVL